MPSKRTPASAAIVAALAFLLASVVLARQNAFQVEPNPSPGNSYCPGRQLPPQPARTCTNVEFPVYCNATNTLHECIEGFKILHHNMTTDETAWDCLSTGSDVEVPDRPQCIDDVRSSQVESPVGAQHAPGAGSAAAESHHEEDGEAAQESPINADGLVDQSTSDHLIDRASPSGGNLTWAAIEALFSHMDPKVHCKIGLTVRLTSVDQYCQVQNFFVYWVNNTRWNITGTAEQPTGKFERTRVLPECAAS